MITNRKPVISLDSRLRDIPREWLTHFEPRVFRSQQHDCWLWMGAMKGGLPLIKSWESGTTVSAPRLMMKMFFDFEDEGHYVRRTGCPRVNCVNPAHYVVTATHPRGNE